jgi:hypothetical protein
MTILKVDNIEKNDIEKQPWEMFNITIDWSDELGSGAGLNTFSTIVYDESGTSVGTTILNGVSATSTVVTIGLQGGSHGSAYTVVSRVTSDQVLPSGDPERFEADIKLTVKDIRFY